MNGLSPLRAKNGRFTFDLNCPKCGEPCRLVTEGNVVAGTRSSAIARCPVHERDLLVVVLLRSGAAKVPQRKRRGTRLLAEN